MLGDVKKHVDSLANGMLEFDFKAGDSVGLMLGDEIIHRVYLLFLFLFPVYHVRFDLLGCTFTPSTSFCSPLPSLE